MKAWVYASVLVAIVAGGCKGKTPAELTMEKYFDKCPQGKICILQNKYGQDTAVVNNSHLKARVLADKDGKFRIIDDDGQSGYPLPPGTLLEKR